MTGRRVLVPVADGVVAGERPTVSIAIAAYQAADTIAEALESAFAQTLPALDVAVCDDGSTDDLDAALAPYADRILLVRQENRGPGAAKSAAARATRGEFVAFLDADDAYRPERLEAIADLAALRPDLDVITTNAELEIDGAVRGLYYPDIAVFPVDDQPARIIANDSAVLGAAAVRRRAFEAAGGFSGDRRSGEDWELFIRLAVRGSRFGCVDEPLYRYRLHDRGASADQVLGWRTAVLLLERVLATEDPDEHVRDVLERTLARHRRIAALVEAEAALRNGAPDARSRALAVARDLAQPPSTRAKALLAVAWPALAARLLDLRERASGRSRLRKPMPRR